MSATGSARNGLAVGRRAVALTVRLAWLALGLVGFGVSLAVLVRAELGLDPWDVLQQGIARRLGVPLGWVVIAVSGLVLMAWVPLRQRPGIGTVANAIVVGLVVDAALPAIPSPHGLGWRVAMLAGAVVLNALATGCYLGAGLGPGPRDGLMLGLAARGHSIRRVRTLLEVSVLGVGALLGGSVGIGTAVYAVAIGPLVHLVLPHLVLPPLTLTDRHASQRRS